MARHASAAKRQEWEERKEARAAFTPVEVVAREPAAGIVIRLPRGALVELPADRPELLQAALSALTAESPAC